MDPQTKFHQFQAYNSVLLAENVQKLKAAVENDENKNLSLSQNLDSKSIISWAISALN